MSLLRERFSWLKEMEKLRLEVLQKGNSTSSIDLSILNTKKAIRKYYKEQNQKEEERIGVVVSNNFDSITCKAFFEGDWTLEEVKDFFEENIEQSYFNSPYDCTGQIFTKWYQIFKLDDKFVLYWCNGRDF